MAASKRQRRGGNCECIHAIAAQNRSSPFGKRILQDGGDAAKAAGEGALTGRQRLHEKAREDGRGARMRRTLRHAVAAALGARHCLVRERTPAWTNILARFFNHHHWNRRPKAPTSACAQCGQSEGPKQGGSSTRRTRPARTCRTRSALVDEKKRARANTYSTSHGRNSSPP